jgi:type II secretory pathway component PulM
MIQITRRERLLSLGAAAVIAVWAVNALALRPARERIRTLQRVLPEQQAELRDLQARSVEYHTLQRRFQQLQAKLASQSADFQLLPFLEKMIDQHKLTRNATMQPQTLQPRPDYSQVVVSVELREVSLEQLVNFLAAVESADAVVQIGSLRIQRNPVNEMLVDSTVGIYSPQRSPQPAPAQLAQVH